MTRHSVLLVKPSYYSRYPPIALMKFSTHFRNAGWKVAYREGVAKDFGFYPEQILITSLYTYEWRAVHEACLHYRQRFPRARIALGGVYATLMADHASSLGVDIHVGQYPEVEKCKLDYSLFPAWKTSIVTASKGCIRNCKFCAVKRLEPCFECFPTIGDQLRRNHSAIVIWDNNFLASPYRSDILEEIVESRKEVDFCQGLDIRLVDDTFLNYVNRLKFRMLRFAYDLTGMKQTVARQVERLRSAGVRPRDIFFYALYNFRDSPDSFLAKIQDILDIGCVAYPMRYEPLDSLKRGSHMGQNWNTRTLDMVNRLRRVLGYHGALPPYEGLRKKICRTSSFERAFYLHPERR